ncbi:hypothetical protein F511_25920 [Dorcoceras hygrometricum]|uniref:Uncharacterized protein n=1 Tax=Dorcoceras hygrometricum TaxID=472368 RepID=A0A2Z7CC80_9LAMI|nr:hypothetical protein F511_25920 [Dorcoceras hygrometricum]
MFFWAGSSRGRVAIMKGNSTKTAQKAGTTRNGPETREATNPVTERKTKTTPATSRTHAGQLYVSLSRSPLKIATPPAKSTRTRNPNTVLFGLSMLKNIVTVKARTGTVILRNTFPISWFLMFSNIGCKWKLGLKFRRVERNLSNIRLRVDRASGEAIACPLLHPSPPSTSAIKRRIVDFQM